MIAVSAVNSKVGKALAKSQVALNLLEEALILAQVIDEAVNLNPQEDLKEKVAEEMTDLMLPVLEASVADVSRPKRFSHNFEIELSIIG